MVPQPPLAERSFGRASRPRHLLVEAIEERIEVVVLNDEDPRVGVLFVVVGRVLDDLQSQRRLAAPLFTEDNGRGGSPRIAVDLVPRGMKRAARANLLKEWIGLSVLLRERVLRQTVMFEKLLDFHRVIRREGSSIEGPSAIIEPSAVIEGFGPNAIGAGANGRPMLVGTHADGVTAKKLSQSPAHLNAAGITGEWRLEVRPVPADSRHTNRTD